MIRPTKVSAHNFVYYRELSARLDRKGLVIIQGENKDTASADSNGAGKSLLYDVISWVLYGKTTRSGGKDDVIGKFDKFAKVTIFLEDVQGDTVRRKYRIIRYRGHPTFKNKVSISFQKDDEYIPLSKATGIDTDVEIEKILGMDWITFTATCLFIQGENCNFAKSTDAGRKKILDNVLKIEKFQEAAKVAKGLSLEIKRDMGSVSDERIEAVSTLTIIKEAVLEMENAVRKFEDEKRDKVENLKVRIVAIEKTSEEFGKLVLEVASLEKEATVWDEVIEDRSSIKLLNEYHSKKSEPSRIKVELESQFKFQKFQQGQIREKINKILEDLSNFEAKKTSEVCNECGADLSKEGYEKLLRPLKKEFNEKTSQMKHTLECLEEVDKQLSSLESIVEESRRLQKEKDAAAARKRDTLRKLEVAREKHKVVSKQREGLEQLREQLTEAEASKPSIDASIVAAKKAKKKELTHKLMRLNLKYKLLLRKKFNFDYWANALGNDGIKNMIFESVFPNLEEYVSEYLSKLTDGDISVSFSSKKEKKTGGETDDISVMIKDKSGQKEFKFWSGGEKNRIGVAIDMGLMRLASASEGSNFDLVMIDEVMDGLDEEGRKRALEVLTGGVFCRGTVLVISHDDYKDVFPNCWKVVREDYESRLVC